MFRKLFCKNFLITQPIGSLQSPTRIEQIKAKFWSSWSYILKHHQQIQSHNPVQKLRQSSDPTKLHSIHETHQTTQVIREATINPPSWQMKPIPETHQTTHAVSQGTIIPPLPLPTNTNHIQNPLAQESSTHQIHRNPTHQKQLHHNLTSRNSTQQS